MRLVKGFFLALLLSVISACGFHLKGAANLPTSLQELTLSLSKDEAFNNELKKQLKQAGARFNENNSGAFLSVKYKVLPELSLAQSSSTGLNIQQLKVQVEYSLKDGTGRWIAQQKLLTQTREFESDSDQLLAKNKEKQVLYHQMKINLVNLMMYQLQIAQ